MENPIKMDDLGAIWRGGVLNNPILRGEQLEWSSKSKVESLRSKVT